MTVVYTDNPYAMIFSVMLTFPVILLNPLTRKFRVLFCGVNATSKSEAENLLLSWHVESDVDVSIGSAEATDVSARSEANNGAVVNRMIAVFGMVILCYVQRCPARSDQPSGLGNANEGLDGRKNDAAARGNAGESMMS
jgi:hypothetical protein